MIQQTLEESFVELEAGWVLVQELIGRIEELMENGRRFLDFRGALFDVTLSRTGLSWICVGAGFGVGVDIDRFSRVVVMLREPALGTQESIFKGFLGAREGISGRSLPLAFLVLDSATHSLVLDVKPLLGAQES